MWFDPLPSPCCEGHAEAVAKRLNGNLGREVQRALVTFTCPGCQTRQRVTYVNAPWPSPRRGA